MVFGREIWIVLIAGVISVDCFSRAKSSDCRKGAFKCQRDECIEHIFVCDGNVDCSNGRDESPECAKQCHLNSTSLAEPGSTIQDSDWWYVCRRGQWRASGCIVDDRRYQVGETFIHETEFWGRCEEHEEDTFERALYGCVDWRGRLVESGQRYLIDPQFWAVCIGSNKTTTGGVGRRSFQALERRIVGCNDGTDEMIPDGQEYMDLVDETRGLGVAIQCSISSPEARWPRVVPISCLIQNRTNPEEFVGLSSGCYDIFGDLIYYCTIAAEISVNRTQGDRLRGTWRYKWTLAWNDTSDQVITRLERQGFVQCPAESDDSFEESLPEDNGVARVHLRQRRRRRRRRSASTFRIPSDHPNSSVSGVLNFSSV